MGISNMMVIAESEAMRGPHAITSRSSVTFPACLTNTVVVARSIGFKCFSMSASSVKSCLSRSSGAFALTALSA